MPMTNQDMVSPGKTKRGPRLQRMMSADGSCCVTASDMEFIAMNSNLSLKEIKHHFEDLIQDKVGKEAFRKILGLCYPTADLEKLEKHVFKVFDPDQSGQIAFRRFMLIIIAMSSGTVEENVEKIFYMVDLNNDGFISVEEYQSVATDIFLLANEKKISTSNKDHLMKTSFVEMDANMDGKVDLREFMRACERHDYIIFHYLKTFVNAFQAPQKM